MTPRREFLLEVDGRRTRISWKRRRAGDGAGDGAGGGDGGVDQADRNKERADGHGAHALYEEKQEEEEGYGDEEEEDDDDDAEEDEVKKDTGIVVVVLPSRILEASRIPQD